MNASHMTAVTIGELSRVKFEWGRCDCCIFVASVVRAVHGIDFLAGWKYASKQEAQTHINRCEGLMGLVTSVVGPPIAAELTVDGEPVLAIDENGVELLGVRFQNMVVFKTIRGVSSLMISDPRVKLGWSVRCQQQ